MNLDDNDNNSNTEVKHMRKPKLFMVEMSRHFIKQNNNNNNKINPLLHIPHHLHSSPAAGCAVAELLGVTCGRYQIEPTNDGYTRHTHRHIRLISYHGSEVEVIIAWSGDQEWEIERPRVDTVGRVNGWHGEHLFDKSAVLCFVFTGLTRANTVTYAGHE